MQSSGTQRGRAKARPPLRAAFAIKLGGEHEPRSNQEFWYPSLVVRDLEVHSYLAASSSAFTLAIT